MVRLKASSEDGLPGLWVWDRDPLMVLLASMVSDEGCSPE
jgi:hypothetical protein